MSNLSVEVGREEELYNPGATLTEDLPLVISFAIGWNVICLTPPIGGD